VKETLAIIFVFVFMVLGFVSIAIRMEAMTTNMITSMNTVQDRVTHLEVTVDPHKRIEDMETWVRTFCIQGKDEACGKLGKVNK
jgi:CHASE3 domain sensor protein